MPDLPPRGNKQAGDPASFEQQLAELERLVDQLERGDLTLEQSVTLFERGVHLSNACKEQLAAAESRIQVLMDPERKGPVRVEELAMAVDEGEDEAEEPNEREEEE